MKFLDTNVRVVLFDIDGVLVDVSNSYRKAIAETASHFLGREITLNAVNRYKNIGGYNDDWDCTAAMLNDAGVKVPFDRIVKEFQRRYRGQDWDGLISNEPPLVEEDTFETLRADGRVLGIVTGRPREEAEWTLNKFEWEDWFPLLVAKEQQDGRTKPDPFCLQKAIAMFGAAGTQLETHEVAYVGDSIDDMKAARRAGVWPIGVIPPYQDQDRHFERLDDAGAEFVLDSVNEICDRLNGVTEDEDRRARARA